MPGVRPCRELDCPYPAMRQKRSCGWHWLAKQPADVQTRAARGRFLASPPELAVARVPAANWPAGTRFCSGCRSFVPLFYCSGSRCRACSSASGHAAAIKKTYGITIKEYNLIMAAQGGRCAICGARPRTKRFAVEHDHITGEVRGICCKRCNHDLLGAAHDDVKLLKRAIAYLEDPPARRILNA